MARTTGASASWCGGRWLVGCDPCFGSLSISHIPCKLHMVILTGGRHQVDEAQTRLFATGRGTSLVLLLYKEKAASAASPMLSSARRPNLSFPLTPG